MSMVFRYRLGRSPQPILTLNGRTTRPRPLLSVTLISPTTTLVRRALLDTGADETVFADTDAPLLGIDLATLPSRTAAGVGSPPYTVRYTQLTLRLTDGREYREWPAWVGFTSAHMAFPLLGFAGCLQFFTATFFGDREQVELTVNSLYPGR